MKNIKTRIHREGRNPLLIITLIIFLLNLGIYIFVSSHWILACTLCLSAIVLVFVAYFFRSPSREFKIDDPDFIVAPADGKVVVIEETDESEFFHEPRLQVSIFMSPFNVHANWYPVEGVVLKSDHQKGRHQAAWLPKSSIENERSLVVIETTSKLQVAVRQIAGAMARRIVTYAKKGDQVGRNEYMGFIKLGSRVDMYLPLDTEIFVEIGDTVQGNSTIIGRLNNPNK